MSGTLLLGLARGSIEHGLDHGEPLPLRAEELTGELNEPAATFTTLRQHGELRGCCGTLEAVQPLATDVVDTAYRAAFRDPRFEPLVQRELGGVRLELSVLSPLEPLPVRNEADLLERLVPGTDGLVIVEGLRRATYLPKVWEMLPDPRHFVAQLKIKCGLPGDYWSEQLEFLRYDTTTYSESA